MSSPKLKMQDAKELASGYQGWFRKVEVFSIASFWALMALMVYRVWPHAGGSPWLVLSAVLVGFIAADFTSGFVGDPVGLDVETHRIELLTELDRQRQAHIAQTHDTDAAASHAQFHDFSVLF
jgi:hypothetical protein